MTTAIPGAAELELAKRGAMLQTIPRKSNRGTATVTGSAQDEKDVSQWGGQWVWLQTRAANVSVVLDVAGESGVLTAYGVAGLNLQAGIAYPFYIPQANDLSLYTYGAAADTLDILGP